MKSTKKKVKNLPPGQTRSRSSVSRLHKDGSLHAVHSTHSMSQVRLQLFREAFHMIDQNRDGIISKGNQIDISEGESTLNKSSRGAGTIRVRDDCTLATHFFV